MHSLEQLFYTFLAQALIPWNQAQMAVSRSSGWRWCRCGCGCRCGWRLITASVVAAASSADEGGAGIRYAKPVVGLALLDGIKWRRRVVALLSHCSRKCTWLLLVVAVLIQIQVTNSHAAAALAANVDDGRSDTLMTNQRSIERRCSFSSCSSLFFFVCV